MLGALDLAVVTSILVFGYAAVWKTRSASQRFPPSPPADPFLGHARSLILNMPWQTYAKWKETYGDVVYLHALGRSIIIIDSVKAARELLEKKSSTFSDRPAFPVFSSMGWALFLPFIRYGARLRKHRKVMHHYFGPQAIANFRPIQEREISKFLYRLSTSPENFINHINNFIAGTLVAITYGHEVKSDHDPYIELVDRATHMATSSGTLGATAIDIFPFLLYLPAWLPGMGLKRLIIKTREVIEQVMNIPLKELQSKRVAGSAPKCIVSDLLDEYDEKDVVDREHEEDIMNIGTTVYNAGSDTTKTSLTAFFLMMTLHPEVAKKAQEEIDLVVGAGRLPSFEDRPSLPYVDCVLKELYRIHPPTPLGVPHASTQVEEYRGWMIPSGTVALQNIWHMMRNEEVFPEPEKFNPERYLDTEKQALIEENDPSEVIFGFGRRVCPGKHFADANLWLSIVNILAVFDIEMCKDPVTGKVEPPVVEMEELLTLSLKPFKCQITPRKGRRVDASLLKLQ
ncbi:cytochrome P450 [Fomitiporia mediterranea MF3/22]|uniref:cytochrome P450 n=1 Tax=Fomitiporia mediterranea (strain MF3/22) TaxID=694068 RepID=UPI0004408C57|nr:cytochrome P450 [Fomitiporia mediterranea MF3/22]EJD05103.1 cytochrome P450 [Fomitiporia mediterranea MF3/22]